MVKQLAYGLFLATTCTARAFQFPFDVPGILATKTEHVFEALGEKPPLRVAIIGAGAAGSSAAFWISKAKERHGLEVEVDIYERRGRVGGRSLVVHPYGNKSIPAVELGASIFVDANRNLMRAAKEFNLTLLDLLDDDEGLGIWDGQNFVVNIGAGGWSGWLDNVKLLWRYGYKSCTRAPKLVEGFLQKFLEVYTPSLTSWESVEDASVHFGFTEQTSQTAESYFLSQGISPLFIHELIEAATRVNYGQNSDDIHGLLGAVSMAADEAHAIKGGNYQIFENFIAQSGAGVHLNITVAGLLKTETSGKTKWFITTSPSPDTPVAGYDHVIVAAPIHNSHITILSSPASFDPPVDYVHLHVTLLSTTSPSLNHTYFGLNKGAKTPSMLLTTWDAVRSGRGEGPEFNSISYHGLIDNGREEKEWVIKVFSKERKSDEWLSGILGDGRLGWVHRAEFDAYPKIGPTTSYTSLHPDTGLWYPNSFESFISTMDTETLSSRNVVDRLFMEQYGAGLCGPGAEGDSSVNVGAGWGGSGAEGRIWGWDC